LKTHFENIQEEIKYQESLIEKEDNEIREKYNLTREEFEEIITAYDNKGDKIYVSNNIFEYDFVKNQYAKKLKDFNKNAYAANEELSKESIEIYKKYWEKEDILLKQKYTQLSRYQTEAIKAYY
jgi:hypothetical protein